ncbi:hypothetical protein DXT76_11905 [Halobacillus trueperi]|uniref:Uncharacterized protein n=1 Tax=Halobacillus trueperi TaxID=156205 RepID=A0A3D8VMJ6_9BACI|nr:hypothetical protein [Halobacillus trueperi]RDY70626.1 hypothetical protein DXT76_11905 [Halobacillus trueperi]
MKRKKPKKENTSDSKDLNLDSLLKLASNLSSQHSLFDTLSHSNGSNDSDDVDLSNIITDISKAASHTFAGIEEKLSKVLAELEKLNKNIESLNHNTEQ